MSALSFSHPATQWLEALPLGNGTLGAMVDGGVPVARLALNDETAWSGSPGSEARDGLVDAAAAAEALASARAAIAAGDPADAERAMASTQARYSQAYLPLGTVLLTRDAEPAADYRRRLDLESAVHELRSGSLHEQTFVSAPHGVLVHRSTEPFDLEIESQLRETERRWHGDELRARLRLPADVAPGHEPSFPAATWSDAPDSALQAVIVARRLPPDDAGRHTLLVATATTYAGVGMQSMLTLDAAVDAALARLDSAEAAGYDAVLAAHRADHAALFEGSRLRLGGDAEADTGHRLDAAFATDRHPLAVDPGLAELLFDYGRYLAIAGSRGRLPATLQGLWNESMQPPWSSNYTLNINTQMTVWSAQVTGIPETAQNLADFVAALADAGTDTARRVYGIRGWVAHHNSDAWLFSNPVGAGRGDARWTAWPMAGPWLVRSLWDAVEFGHGDVAALWPTIRDAALAGLDWHHRDEAGWSTSPATSPENAYLLPDGTAVAMDRTSALDRQLLGDLFRITVSAAERLGLADDPVPLAARERLAALVEPRIADGRVLEWAAPHAEEDPRHRHVSHLYGLFPGAGDWGDEARRAAAAVLRRRGDDSSGWSLVWKLALWARLGRGDKASDLLRLLFRDARSRAGEWAGGLYPNLFAAHPPFQIDANLGFPGALVECLLQSHDGIELLPALPPELDRGRLTGAIARPGIRVDLHWQGAALVSVSLQATTRAAAGEHRVGYCDRWIVREIGVEQATVIRAAEFESGKQ